MRKHLNTKGYQKTDRTDIERLFDVIQTYAIHKKDKRNTDKNVKLIK